MRCLFPPAAVDAGRLALDDPAGPAGSLDALAGTRAERVRVHGQGLAEVALGEHLDGDLLAADQTPGSHLLERHLRSRVEAGLQRRDVDRLHVSAKRLE